MEITEEIISQVENYGARNYPVRYILQLLCRTAEEKLFLKSEFDNPESEVSQARDRGFILHEADIDKKLEEKLEEGGEGAGEVAKALNFRRKGREMDDLKRELFGT